MKALWYTALFWFLITFGIITGLVASFLINWTLFFIAVGSLTAATILVIVIYIDNRKHLGE